MSFLLRVALPDVPGSLGRLASAIGTAGGNIDAIEIVEHGAGGRAVDDVFLTLDPGTMPDSVVSACTALEGVDVLWISRYTAGGNLFLDLEVVESMTQQPARALDLLVEALPMAFRVDWAVQVTAGAEAPEVVRRTPAAPDVVPGDLLWPEPLAGGVRLDAPAVWGEVILAGCPLAKDLVLIGRRGGPAILDSEIARLRHLCALADSIARD